MSRPLATLALTLSLCGCLALTPLEGLVGQATDAGIDATGVDAGPDSNPPPLSDASGDVALPSGGFVQKAQWSNGAPYKCTLPANVTAGHLVVALAISSPPDPSVTISDTLGQTWKSSNLSSCVTENLGLRIYYAESAKAGAETVTMQVGGGTLYGLALLEYSGFQVLDAEGGSCSLGASSALTTPKVTTTNAALMISIFTTLTPTAIFVPGSGWTLRDNNAGFYMWEDRIVGSAGAYQGTATQKDNTTWTSLIVAFRAK